MLVPRNRILLDRDRASAHVQRARTAHIMPDLAPGAPSRSAVMARPLGRVVGAGRAWSRSADPADEDVFHGVCVARHEVGG
jgi:hypothetical protein